MISHSLLLELKQILEEECNLKLTTEEVMDIGTTLLAFVETLIKIETKNNYENKSTIKTS
ncbi:hypothetical protein KKE78_01705 [Patescibacteria group bacterium]|nr:hypothetical protein [Patescibacteria group bacterium]